MAPKKNKKISLNEFLGDSALGSWADEMESLPNAPAARNEEDGGQDRFGRRGDDFLSSRPDRQSGPPREDVPLPTQPPYTAFVGNLAFDLTEAELGDFFSGIQTKSVKIIRDRDDKPKGFGYIEFEDLEGLKEALTKSGTSFSGRTVRVSVAEPPKNSGFGAASEDNAKFENPWRRDGPLPDIPGSRDASRRRFDGPPGERPERPVAVSDTVDQWRSSRPLRAAAPGPEVPEFKRKGSGFNLPDAGAADKEESWSIGGKFKPSTGPEEGMGRARPRGDMGSPKEAAPSDEGDWRSARPARSLAGTTRGSTSPNSSTPPTPQLARKKLELLPKSGSASLSPSPLSSPKIAPAVPASKPSPFGAAKPVDVSNREKEVTERIEKEKEAVHEKVSMSRSNSRPGMQRPGPAAAAADAAAPASAAAQPKPAAAKVLAPTVRPTLSFANVAAKKESALKNSTEAEEVSAEADKVTEDMAKVEL